MRDMINKIKCSAIRNHRKINDEFGCKEIGLQSHRISRQPSSGKGDEEVFASSELSEIELQ